MLKNKDYIKKMTVEDYMSRCGLDPDDDVVLANFLLEQADCNWATDSDVDPGCLHCVHSVDGHPSDVCNDGDACPTCDEAIVEWLNLKHEGPIPVVAKPFAYHGCFVNYFSIDYDGKDSYLVLYDDDDLIIDKILFPKEEQDKMYEAVGGYSSWQWNYIADKYGEEISETTVEEYLDDSGDIS